MSMAAYEAPETNTRPQLTKIEGGRSAESGEAPITSTLLPLVEIYPVPESLPQAAELLRRLGENFENGHEMIHFLAQHGIFVWVKDELVGMHIKRERGRDHDARILTSLSDAGIDQLDMNWQNGAGPYQVDFDGHNLPVELAVSLNDILEVEKERQYQKERIASWKGQYSGLAAHRAHRSYTGKNT